MENYNQNKKFKIEGKIWWGNGAFLKGIIVEDDKEVKAKEKFLTDITKNLPDIDNFILLLNKYVPIIDAKIIGGQESKTWFSIENKCIGGDSKKFFLNAAVKRFKIDKIPNFQEMLIVQIASLVQQGYKLIFNQNLKTQSRLIIGLGSSHVLETSITLHHIYGIPYIPATALKGVCRMVAFWKIAEKKNILSDAGKLADLQNEFYGELSSDGEVLKYQLLFGAQNFKGLLLFLDAYPIIKCNEQIFELDIMNVHYSSYYGGKTGNTPPGDWENPNPIFFLTLKEGIEFDFTVLFDNYRAGELLKLSDGELEKLKIPKISKEVIKEITPNLSSWICELIKEALNTFGVGAKTRLGYGIFE